jgi:hypothetical protein
MAKARGIPLSQQELDRIVDPLETLDATFRELSRELSPDVEPATGLHLEAQPE